jgi:Spy/CpxP family protein refolding chaperone
MKQTMNWALAGALVLGAACAQKPATAQTTTPSPQVSTQQDGGERRGRRGGDRSQALFGGITLTADQQTQVTAIRERHRSEMQALNPRDNPDDRAKMMQNMQTQLAEIRAVLTPDQQTQFDKNVAEMRDRMQQRGGPGGPPPARN